MDSFTQIALGAAVGQAARGPRLGRAAALWGAMAGTVPDLDVLAYPFLDPAAELIHHRGITHGLAFGIVAGPLLGWLVWRLRRWRGRAASGGAASGGTGGARGPAETWRDWALVMGLGLVTHPLLDVFTVYGTQLLAPFSDAMLFVGSLFILDPLVTVPLALAVAVGLWRPRLSRRAALVGLAAACAYVGAGVGLQAHARSTAEAALAGRGAQPERVIVTAGPLSSLVWRGVALEGGRLTPFSLHVTDPPQAVLFDPPVPLAAPPEGFAESRNGRTLLWFSHGWLADVTPEASGDSAPGDTPGARGPVYADVRFGRGGLDPTDAWVFRWRVEPEPPFAFRQVDRVPSFERGEFARLWRWIAGRRAAAARGPGGGGGPDPGPLLPVPPASPLPDPASP